MGYWLEFEHLAKVASYRGRDADVGLGATHRPADKADRSHHFASHIMDWNNDSIEVDDQRGGNQIASLQ